MGQRFQIVIVTPEEFVNKDNVNNRKGSIYIYHCQWSWGHHAVYRWGKLLQGIRILLEDKAKENTKTWINYFKEIIDPAMQWACYSELKYQNNVHLISEEYEGFKFEDENDSFKNLFDRLNNNNGILFIEITKRHKIRYFFYNPRNNEGRVHGKCLNWHQYLDEYNTESDLKKHFESEKKIAFKMMTDEFENSIFLNKVPKVKKWMIKEKVKENEASN